MRLRVAVVRCVRITLGTHGGIDGRVLINGCRRVEDLAESSGILLDWYLPAEAIHIEGDEVLLQRLLGILLDNAIRYTPEFGEIRTEVSLVGDNAFVTVRDTGVGMSEDVRLHVFNRFYEKATGWLYDFDPGALPAGIQGSRDLQQLFQRYNPASSRYFGREPAAVVRPAR